MFQVFLWCFYGRAKQQNSPAHCSAIQNSKLNLNSTEIALSKPVSVISVLADVEIFIHVMAQIFKSGDLSNLIRSFDFISGGFLSKYFNAC